MEMDSKNIAYLAEQVKTLAGQVSNIRQVVDNAIINEEGIKNALYPMLSFDFLEATVDTVFSPFLTVTIMSNTKPDRSDIRMVQSEVSFCLMHFLGKIDHLIYDSDRSGILVEPIEANMHNLVGYTFNVKLKTDTDGCS